MMKYCAGTDYSSAAQSLANRSRPRTETDAPLYVCGPHVAGAERVVFDRRRTGQHQPRRSTDDGRQPASCGARCARHRPGQGTGDHRSIAVGRHLVRTQSSNLVFSRTNHLVFSSRSRFVIGIEHQSEAHARVACPAAHDTVHAGPDHRIRHADHRIRHADHRLADAG